MANKLDLKIISKFKLVCAKIYIQFLIKLILLFLDIFIQE